MFLSAFSDIPLQILQTPLCASAPTGSAVEADLSSQLDRLDGHERQVQIPDLGQDPVQGGLAGNRTGQQRQGSSQQQSLYPERSSRIPL